MFTVCDKWKLPQSLMQKPILKNNSYDRSWRSKLSFAKSFGLWFKFKWFAKSFDLRFLNICTLEIVEI